MSISLSDRIAQIRSSLPNSVRLVAVSKQVPVGLMREAYKAGVRDFAESRIQEATWKISELQDLTDITWHLIGHLQTNKVKKALEIFHWIHSLDSLKLAQRLDTLAHQLSIYPKVCLQVKILPDPSKSGWSIPQLLSDLPALNQCQNLKIQGLMTIPPLGLSISQTLDVFKSTAKLASDIEAQNWSNIQMRELSMGMSGDYLLAVQAGATMVRIGTTMFGERSPTDVTEISSEND